MLKYPEHLKEVELKHFINGEYVASKGQGTFAVINPATEEPIGSAAIGSQEDVDLAVKAAKEAFKTWRHTDAHVRGKILLKVSELIIKNLDVLAYYESLNCGKPISKTTGFDIPLTSYFISYFAGMADKIKGHTLKMFHPHFGMTIKEPIGVVGAILPWNYPIPLMSWKLGAALAAGCTVVIKPAEQSPYTTLMFCRILNEAGVPPGVVNVVTGEGQTGELVSVHKGISKITFTGST